MLLWRVRSPTQQQEKDRHQTGKRCNSRKKYPKSTSLRRLRRWRTCHAAKARRTRQLSFLVRYTFTTERTSAMRAPRRRFTQWMKQAVRVTQARRGPFVELRGWSVRSHSSVWHPRWERLRNRRKRMGRRVSPVRDLSREQPVARSRHGWYEPPHLFSRGLYVLRAFDSPRRGQRLLQWYECGTSLSAPTPALMPPTRHLCPRKPRPS